MISTKSWSAEGASSRRRAALAVAGLGTLLLALPACGSSPAPRGLGAERRPPKCVVIILPPGGWADLPPRTREALVALAREGAGGSMSCAVPRPMSEAAGWVTLGAGNRAIWPRDVALGNVVGSADQAERSRFAEALRRANEGLPYPIEIGSLGEALHRAGKRTAILGLREPWQPAAVMDASGHTDLASKEASPQALLRALEEADCTVINGQAAGGDSGIASLLLIARGWTAPKDLLIVAGLAPKDSPFAGLSPIAVLGIGFSNGVLTSSTTRRPGLVANIDLAPTILQHFGVPLPASYRNGSPMRTDEREAFEVGAAIRLDAKGRQVDTSRPLLLPVCFLLQALLVPLCILRGWPPSPSQRAALMLALACMPAASYVTAALPTTWPAPALLAVVLVVACVPGLWPLLSPLRATEALSVFALAAGGVTMVIVTMGQSRGAPLPPLVPLGYALGFGGRFYGIGNELAGLLMAAGAVAGGLLMGTDRPSAALPRYGRGGLAVLLSWAPLLVIVSPQLGANAGCTVAAAVCVGALFVARLPARRRWAVGPLVALSATALLLLVACLDAHRAPQSMTHIGRAWLRLTSEGWPYLSEFVRRKSTTVWRNVTLVPALVPLAGWALFWVYALLRPIRFVGRVYEGMPALRAPLQAIAVSGLAAALLNDSTVTIPLTMLQFALPILGLASLAPDGHQRSAEESSDHA